MKQLLHTVFGYHKNYSDFFRDCVIMRIQGYKGTH